MKNKGFTLVELLVIILILGALSAIGLAQFQAHRAKTYNAAALSDIRNVKSVLEMYYNDNQCYP